MEVQLLGVPVDDWARLSAHNETVRRELDILRIGNGENLARIDAYMTALDSRFPEISEELAEELRLALQEGRATANLAVKLPRRAATVARSLQDILTEVDSLCSQETPILTIETPPDLVRFREWFLGEIVRQIETGGSPRDWASFRQPMTEPVETVPADTTGQPGSVVFAGELDIATVAELQGKIQQAHQDGVLEMVIDLTGVTFIDSVGLSVLMTAHNRLTEEGGSVVLRMPSRLRTLLELSGLLEVLEVTFVE